MCVQELEDLALRDADPRVRHPAAAALALTCFALRRGPPSVTTTSLGEDSGHIATAAVVSAAAQGLSSLPADGAMRPLAEPLLDGSLARQPDAEQEAAVLRVLAAAERLPGLPWGSFIQQLLARKPGALNRQPCHDPGRKSP